MVLSNPVPLGVSLVLAFFAISCGVVRKKPSVSLFVTAAQGANGDAAIPVDLVAVWDNEFAKAFSDLSAKDWYSGKKKQFRLSDPLSKKHSVHEWEWVPDQAVPKIHLKLPRNPKALLLFAGYAGDAGARASVPTNTDVFLELKPSEVQLRVPAGGDPGKKGFVAKVLKK